MIEALVIQVFGQSAARYGPLIALGIVLTLIMAILGFWYAKTQIDLMRRSAEVKIEREDRERQQLIAEVTGARAQLHTFLTNHLVHDEQSRRELAETLGRFDLRAQAHVTALNSISDDLKAHRVEEGSRAKDFHQKLDEMHRDIIRCDGSGSA